MSNRNFLVIVDGTKEMDVALQYACVRAKKTNGHLILASFIKPIDVLTTKSVGDIMKNEAREEAEANLHKASAYVKEETGIAATLHVREGEILEELLKLIEDEKNISVLILAANIDEKKGPGPIISSILTKNYARFNIPVMIVPSNFSKDHIKEIG
ncbi:MAG: universal stress protein [Pelagibacteraceae bacterium]|nr:universal stress protein [Pelagibacteraceae bacterium]|tara:strand:+ start:20515 stop:20982 length:468 start_codon:yes stop_codon:yes gene_type:complete